MDFTSPSQQEFWLRGMCTHKAWEGLQTEYDALTDAFRTIFIMEDPANAAKCVPEFEKWLKDDRGDETFAFYAWILTDLFPALVCLYKGTRNHCVDVLTAAHRLFMNLWFIFGNDIYGPDSMHDIMLWFHRVPSTLFDFWNRYCWCINGQGSDLVCCEESINQIKRRRYGRGSTEKWKIACSTVATGHKNRDRNMKLAGLTEVDLAQRTPTDKTHFRRRMVARVIKGIHHPSCIRIHLSLRCLKKIPFPTSH